MCIVSLVWDAVPGLLLFLAFNRDEALARPTAPLHIWNEHPHIVGGRDLERGGTWLAITTEGRFAFLTNVSVPSVEERTGTLSRGDITVKFLEPSGGQGPSPLEYLRGLDGSAYNSLNLFVGDLRRDELAYFTNRDGVFGKSRVAELGKGIHVVSNDVMGEDWPKTKRLRREMTALVDRYRQEAERGGLGDGWVEGLHQDALGVLNDSERCARDDSELPTAAEFEGNVRMEAMLDRIFIPELRFLEPKGDVPGDRLAEFLHEREREEAAKDASTYGTRSQTIVTVTTSGLATVTERSRQADGTWAASTMTLQLDLGTGSRPATS